MTDIWTGLRRGLRPPVARVAAFAAVSGFIGGALGWQHDPGPGLAVEAAAAPAARKVVVKDDAAVVVDLPVVTEPSTSTTTEPATTVPPTTASPPPAPPVTEAAAAATASRFTLAPYRGLGAWLDVYDWTATYGDGSPAAGVADIDRMAGLGVRTVFIQGSKWNSPTTVLEPDLLGELIDRAHANGMYVVLWYLPTLVDPAADLARLVDLAALPVDGIGVDIESREVADVAERNRRLVQLSADLAARLPGEVISAIVMEPVLMEDVNPNFWPNFPWAEIAPYYGVWQPMSYWTNRKADSGWRDGYMYTATNIDRIRTHTGNPEAVVHSIGGIGNEPGATADQIDGMLRASTERGAIGGSIYDYRTTSDELWAVLAGFN